MWFAASQLRLSDDNQSTPSRDDDQQPHDMDDAASLSPKNSDMHGTIMLSPETVDIHRDTAPNGQVLSVLLELQQRLMMLKNKDVLKQVARIIVDAGAGSVSSSTFDFDLCKLDARTVNRIQSYVRDQAV